MKWRTVGNIAAVPIMVTPLYERENARLVRVPAGGRVADL